MHRLGRATHAPGRRGSTLCGRAGKHRIGTTFLDVDCFLCTRNKEKLCSAYGWVLLAEAAPDLAFYTSKTGKSVTHSWGRTRLWFVHAKDERHVGDGRQIGAFKTLRAALEAAST